MKKIGLIGGMSWESTITYYKVINEAVRDFLGGLHSAPILLDSVDFAAIAALQEAGDWAGCAKLLTAAAQKLETIGADFIVICTNTQHIVAPEVEKQLQVPLLHIADVAVEALEEAKLASVALLGTNYTVQHNFYKDKLSKAGIEVLVPESQEQAALQSLIFDELCQGQVTTQGKEQFQNLVAAMAARGAKGVLLACTELDLLLRQDECPLPLFDTTVLHATKAANLALGIL